MKINYELLKHFLKYPISRISRNYIRNFRPSIKLIMTLVVRNEEEIIEKHIKFHKEMGVDGFIVTSHKSDDKTNEILENLKKEGIVLEVIYKDTPDHQHSIWVNDMIRIAKRKYKADWVINSDADEFYYSKALNLKESIVEYKNVNANVLTVDSVFIFPSNEKNFLESPYWVTKPFQPFEVEQLKINDDNRFKGFVGSHACPKVIHTTKNFKRIADGNHSVKMYNKKQVYASNITLYHYHIRNYKGYEEKVKRWFDSAKYMPKGNGEHMKLLIELYKQNKLRETYDKIFGENVRNFLIKQGVVSVDKSVLNFLKWKGIMD